MSVSGRRQTGEDVGQQSPERPPSLLAVALRMVDDVDDARDLLWDSLLPALRATRLHADPFHVPYPGAGGGPAPSVSTGFRSAIESPSAGRTWWQFWVAVRRGIGGHPGARTPQTSPRNPRNGPRLACAPERIPKLDVAQRACERSSRSERRGKEARPLAASTAAAAVAAGPWDPSRGLPNGGRRGRRSSSRT